MAREKQYEVPYRYVLELKKNSLKIDLSLGSLFGKANVPHVGQWHSSWWLHVSRCLIGTLIWKRVEEWKPDNSHNYVQHLATPHFNWSHRPQTSRLNAAGNWACGTHPRQTQMVERHTSCCYKWAPAFSESNKCQTTTKNATPMEVHHSHNDV